MNKFELEQRDVITKAIKRDVLTRAIKGIYKSIGKPLPSTIDEFSNEDLQVHLEFLEVFHTQKVLK